MEKLAMQFELRVIGDRLYSTLSNKAAELTKAMLHLCRQTEPICPTIVKLVDRPQLNDLLLQGDTTKVLLVEAHDMSLIYAIQSMERKELAFLSHSGSRLPRLAPLIAVFESPDVLADIRDLPELISDWTFLPLDPSELARRIFSALKGRTFSKPNCGTARFRLFPKREPWCFSEIPCSLSALNLHWRNCFLARWGP
jgi:hypothetical protein